MKPSAYPAELRNAISRRLALARARTDSMFSVIRHEALYDRPIAERHRLIFYIGHLEAFDFNLLCRDSLGRPSWNPEFDKLFAFGIDPVDGGLPQDQPADWPDHDVILEYCRRARREVDACLEGAAFSDPSIPYFRNGWAFHIAVEHRLMHAETLGYLLHWLPYEKKVLQPAVPELEGAVPPRRLVEIPAGRVTMGLKRSVSSESGWDNEYEQHVPGIPLFAIDSHNVTNREFLAFVHNGGYRDAGLWQDADWEWIRSNGIRHPRFWARRNDSWYWRGMFAEFPLPPEWPVYVSQAEAAAYARWKNMSLPTEAQIERAAYGSPDGNERTFPWGESMPSPHHGNFNFQGWEPVPVGSRPAGTSAFGVADLTGNGWEWTSSLFEPFPGFQPLPFYRTYSANFFGGQHYVMKGGSALTEASLLRRTFRNWFQPHYPNIYATFRCVKN